MMAHNFSYFKAPQRVSYNLRRVDTLDVIYKGSPESSRDILGF